MQSYFIPKPLMLSAGSSMKDELPELERNLFARALNETDGKITIANIAEWAMVSPHAARKLQATWAARGWISKDSTKDNSFCITAKTRALVTNPQTAQTSQTNTNPKQQGDYSA
jgi:hypothetical protein